MNTDASTVEDINIHQIMERSSMSCIASSGERSSIFRNRSFTLSKNDRDLREKFDSVAVSVSIPSSMTYLSYTGLPVLVFDISQDFHTSEDHLSPMFHSEWLDELAHSTDLSCDCLLHSYRAQRYVLTFRFGFPRAFRCSQGKHVRIPHSVSRDQIHHRLRLCCDSFFNCILCSFRHRFQIIDRKAGTLSSRTSGSRRISLSAA